jgi:diguanylate cyclase (GGDEF)-like protein
MSQFAAPHPEPKGPHQSPLEGVGASGKRGFWERQPQRRRNDRNWFQALVPDIVPDILDSLREHSVFSLDGPTATAPPRRGALASQLLREADRDTLYERELLRIFRARVRLVGGLGLFFLPLFTAFYFFLAPETSNRMVVICALIMLSLVVSLAISGTLLRLFPMRALVQGCYVTYCLGNAAEMAVAASDIARHGEPSRAVLIVVAQSFIPAFLSILLLPFTLGETLLASAITVGFLSLGLYSTGLDTSSPGFLAQMFVMLTTSFFVVLISHLGSLLRQRAFHSAFDLALQAARMQQVSATDQLTGGFNRRYIETVLGIELVRGGRFSHPVSILMFDLDNFKPVNDTLGHAAGDEVLRQVWRAAGAALREGDTLARFGGDEFVIVLPETASPAARAIADRLRTAVAAHLRERFGESAIEGRVTLSIGVLTLDGHAPVEVETALARADSLLYEAKRDGKNRTVVG